jgi:hypothetical protein
MYIGERKEKILTALEKLYYRHKTGTEIKEVPTLNSGIFIYITTGGGEYYQHNASSRQFL